MYCDYVYVAAANPTQISADIKALLTGETNKANLSASCNQTSTELYTTDAAGWTAEAATGLIDVYDVSLAAAINIGTVTDCIYAAGSINLWVACGSAGIATSSDGKVWTTRSSIANFKALAFNGTVLVASVGISGIALQYYSSDAITWTASSTSPSLGNAQLRTGTKSSTFYIPNGVNATSLYTTTDGITYTTRTVPIGTYYATASDGTIVVTIGTSIAATSTNDTTWTQSTGLPAGTYRDIVWTGTRFVAIGDNGVCATSSTGLSGSWTQRTLPDSNNYNSLEHDSSTGYLYAISTSGTAVQSLDGGLTWANRVVPAAVGLGNNDSGDFVVIPAATGYTYLAKKDQTNFLVKAVCVDTLRYKYAHIDVSPYYTSATAGVVRLIGYTAGFTNGISTGDKSYNSDSAALSQRIDLSANAGLISIKATVQGIFLSSMMGTGSALGSSTGEGFSFLWEYAPRDGWSTNALGYPCFVTGNTNTITTGLYSPRLCSTAVADATGATAVMLLEAFPHTTTSLGSTKDFKYPLRKLGCYSTTLTNNVLGGVVLGDIYRLLDSIGQTRDTLDIGGVTYKVFRGGTTLTAFRLAVSRR